MAGEEITFDYQFERYGKTAQRCFCGSAKCRQYIVPATVAEERTRTRDTREGLTDRKVMLSLLTLLCKADTSLYLFCWLCISVVVPDDIRN